MSRTVTHTIYLIISIVLVWLWSSSSVFSVYNLQLTGVLTLVYFGFRFSLRSTNQNSLGFPSTIILNTIVLLLVFSTGGISSPLFFLLDLLLFALALLFEPIQAIITATLLILIFFLQNITQMNTQNIINLLSLGLMTPIAIGFSRSYLEALETKGKVKILAKVLKETESESLLWISRQVKPSLASVLNSTTDLVMYFNSRGKDLVIPPGIVDKLKAIQQDMITLYTSASSLEKTIEHETDKVNI